MNRPSESHAAFPALLTSARYYLVHLVPVIFLIAIRLDNDRLAIAPSIVFFFVIPLLDPLLGKSFQPISETTNVSDHLARIAPLLFLLLYFAVFVAGAIHVAGGKATLLSTAAAILTVATTGTISFSTIHEILHGRREWTKLIARVALSLLCFLHFEIEHLNSHHRFVGTSRDTSTARRGESSYAFLIRSTTRGFAFAWRFERTRVINGGLIGRTLRNRVTWCVLLPVAIGIVISYCLGTIPFMFFLGQAFIASSILMIVAYVQHYGLQKTDLAKRFTPTLAWDSNYRLSNWVNFNVQRHADHHLGPRRGYLTLGAHEAAPELPAGYQAMILLSLVPPLWRRLMDRRLEQLKAACSAD